MDDEDPYMQQCYPGFEQGHVKCDLRNMSSQEASWTHNAIWSLHPNARSDHNYLNVMNLLDALWHKGAIQAYTKGDVLAGTSMRAFNFGSSDPLDGKIQINRATMLATTDQNLELPITMYHEAMHVLWNAGGDAVTDAFVESQARFCVTGSAS